MKDQRFTIIIIACLLLLLFATVYAEPIGPVATKASESTRSTLDNATLNESNGGGYIYTYTFDAFEQNERWKAYVGNVTGTLALDDAQNYTIYEWDLGVTTARVFATRSSSSVNWTGVNCTWMATADHNYTNRTITINEDNALQHTRLDNITATFNQRNHSSFQVGDIQIEADTCYSIFPWVNNSQQTTTTLFQEVLLYDGPSVGTGKVIFTALGEADEYGYNNQTYDFQMLVPEVGTDSWSSSTAYYFYVELS